MDRRVPRLGDPATAATAPGRYATTRRRMRTLEWGLVVWALVVVTRLYWLQVVDHHWLETRAQQQQQKTVAVSAERGTIYDRNLTPLAMSLPVESLFANPKLVPDPKQEAAELATQLGMDQRELARNLDSKRTFVWVARKITADQARAVEALHLPGIYSEPATRRFYPKGELAASVLGYVGVDGEGLGGVEHSWDSVIHGQDGRAVVEVDAHRQGYGQVERAPEEGESLILTLDQNLQYIAQQELDRRVAETHARSGVAVVEDPRTGEILALANSPGFNPDEAASTPAARLGDAAVSSPYEPGSVFKLVTLSGALQQGLITPDEMIDCQMGSIKVGGRIIHDHAKFGVISVTDILKHSSDVGAIKIGEKLGDQEMYRYIRAFGFGAPTGIKLPGESRGIVRPPQRWTAMSIGAVSMGQEVAVTPVQVVAMLSTLANGGVYHAPRVVLGKFRGAAPAQAPAFTPAPGRQVVSPLVANEMKQMMAQVVLAGTATQARLNGYTAAGKTGTAQKVDPGGHRYSTHNYISSFGGFAPINDPALTILVVIDSPQGGHEGGPTAGPVFKAIAERALPYLGVAHDVPVLANPAAPSIAAQDAVEESEELDAPAVETPLPAATAPTPPAGRVVVAVGSAGQVAMPDFSGQTVRAVSAECARLGLALSLQGNGVARAQTPAPGTRLSAGARVAVRFEP